MSALLLMANGHAGDTSNKAANQEPVSLGAYFGSLSQFQPSAKVLAIYAEGDVSFTTLQTMIAQNKVPTDYIHRTRREQIGRLLEFAKKLAIEYNAPAFAVANMQVNTIFTSHEIIVETWGDLLAIQP